MSEKMTEVRCSCRVCGGAGALVRGEGTFGGKKITPTMAHNLVRLARSPLGGRDVLPLSVAS